MTALTLAFAVFVVTFLAVGYATIALCFRWADRKGGQR